MDTVERVATLMAEENAHLVEDELPDESAKKWRSPGFQRMRTEWRGEDRPIMDQVRHQVENRLIKEFNEAYRLIYAIFDIVREPKVDPLGNPVLDANGLPVWAKDSTGQYIEDYTRLGMRKKEDFLFALTTNLFMWEQQAADAWGEAMFAKAEWEENFSSGFVDSKGTDELRTQRGRMEAREERYFAVLLSWYSRKADALVRSMERLSQRLKDTMV